MYCDRSRGLLVGELYFNIPRCIVTEREGEATGHLYCNTPKCIVTGGQCIVTQYTVSESLFWTLFLNNVHKIF